MKTMLQLIDEYEDLIQRVRALFEAENRALRTAPEQPDQELLSRKQELLFELEAKLESLRNAREAEAGDRSWLRDRLSLLQQKFLQVLRLDRENEKLLLAGTITPSAASGPVNRTAVAKAYGGR